MYEKSMGLKSDPICILVLPLANYDSKFFILSEPQFPHL